MKKLLWTNLTTLTVTAIICITTATIIDHYRHGYELTNGEYRDSPDGQYHASAVEKYPYGDQPGKAVYQINRRSDQSLIYEQTIIFTEGTHAALGSRAPQAIHWATDSSYVDLSYVHGTTLRLHMPSSSDPYVPATMKTEIINGDSWTDP